MKKYDVIGYYMGGLDVVNTLEGDDKKCELNNGINGDGCDEFQFSVGIDEIVKIGTDIGLWKLTDGQLVEVCDEDDNIDKWDEFYELTDDITINSDED